MLKKTALSYEIIELLDGEVFDVFEFYSFWHIFPEAGHQNSVKYRFGVIG